jgi:hypothetical protein
MWVFGWFVDALVDAWDSVFGPSDDGPARGPRARAIVPEVRGLDLDEASTALSREGFRIEIVRLEERPAAVMGMVIEQEPRPGVRRRRGHRVKLHVLHPAAPRPSTAEA